jgi:hypothetical protein
MPFPRQAAQASRLPRSGQRLILSGTGSLTASHGCLSAPTAYRVFFSAPRAPSGARVCREATPAPDNLFFLFAVCDRQVARTPRSGQCLKIFLAREASRLHTGACRHPRRTEFSSLHRVRRQAPACVAKRHQRQIIFSFSSPCATVRSPARREAASA